MIQTLHLIRLGQFTPLPTRLLPNAAKAEIDSSRARLAAVKEWVAAIGKNNISSVFSATDAKDFLDLYATVEKDTPAIDYIYGQIAAGPWVQTLGYVDQTLVDDITEWGVQVDSLHQLMTVGQASSTKPGTPTSPSGTAALPGAKAGGIGTKEILIGSGAALGLGTLVYLLFKG